MGVAWVWLACMQRKACLAGYFNIVDSEVQTGQVVWAWGTGMYPLTPL